MSTNKHHHLSAAGGECEAAAVAERARLGAAGAHTCREFTGGAQVTATGIGIRAEGALGAGGADVVWEVLVAVVFELAATVKIGSVSGGRL